MVITKTIKVDSKKELDMINITDKVQDAVGRSGAKTGTVTIFVPGATGAITAIEYENGLLKDFAGALEKIAPKHLDYEHHKKWDDDNGRSHVKASLIGPDMTVPFKDEKLILGTWQAIVFVELDTRPREREIILQILGE